MDAPDPNDSKKDKEIENSSKNSGKVSSSSSSSTSTNTNTNTINASSSPAKSSGSKTSSDNGKGNTNAKAQPQTTPGGVDQRLLLIQKGKSCIHDYVNNNNLYEKIPDWKLKKAAFETPSIVISGPYSKQTPPSTFGHSFALTISTYPHFSGKSSREGDPICDSYRNHVHRSGSIICVADGCGWGERPKNASNRVKDSFVSYFEEKVKSIKSTREIAEHLVNSIAYANYSIYYDTPNPWMTGTTTVIGGLLVECLEPVSGISGTPWVFVGISVGDCKCFRYDMKSRMCTDATAGNRMNIVDPRDPGGRLGAQQRNGDPDLRNLDFVFSPLAEGDILIVASDGVHDNLDPQVLGKSPREFGLEAENWDDVGVEEGTKIKTDFMNNFLTDLINSDGRDITPSIITKKLITHCRNITAVSRQWMEQNPNKVLAVDYEKFPGKLDHATCLALVVGPYNPDSDSVMQSRSLHKEVWPFS